MIPRTHRVARRAICIVVAIAMACLAGAPVADASAYLGSASRLGLKQPIVGMAATPSGKGYWLVAADGGIFTYGDARFYGSTGNRALNQPIVGMAATPTGRGYWLVAADGGIFTFGNARFRGSTGNRALNQPIVAMEATPSGRGYWLVAADGGIFTFGNARFRGSTGNRALNQPIVGMAATPTGRGYWLVAADGGIFTFGNARFRGSASTRAHFAAIAGMAATPSGKGYWIVSADGATFAFGDARPFGTRLAAGASDVVTIATAPRSTGYWVAARDGAVGTSTTTIPTRASTGPRAIAFELFLRMNAERVNRHMAPLAWDPLLAGHASSWAQTLLASNQFRHQSLGAIVEAAGGRFAQVGENLYSGTGAAADAGTAHLALLASAEHRENLLLPQGRLVGIGAACSGGKLVVVEDFAITMGAPLPPPGQGVAPATPVAATNPGGAHC